MITSFALHSKNAVCGHVGFNQEVLGKMRADLFQYHLGIAFIDLVSCGFVGSSRYQIEGCCHV